jgi:solute carrier family 45 protein 1/2/4
MVCRDVQWLRKRISSALTWTTCADLTQPYLLSLGISKSMLALVWIAGPLSGALVQPYVGMKSDNCRMKWGKRRPFIVGGAAATIVSLMVLAWASELMGGFLAIFGADREGDFVKTSIVLFAVLFVYVLDFAINVSKYQPWTWKILVS